MAEIKLGNSGFTTSPERDALAALRRKYADIGIQHRNKFLATYLAFRTADELFQCLPDVVERAVSETVSLVANDIAANKVYDIDGATLRASLIGRLAGVRERFDSLQEAYLTIIGKAAELDAQRAEAMENRGRVVGGGFGIEGAARGMAVAAAANAAIGLTKGLANLTAKAASALGDRRKKRDLLEDPSTKSDLADFIASIVVQGHLVVAEVANSAAVTPVYDVISGDARQRGAAIIENIEAGRVLEEDLGGALVEALRLNPFADDPWRIWIDRFGDPDGSVAQSADILGIATVKAYKAHLYLEKHASLGWATPEECEENLPKLEAFTRSLGLQFKDERERIRDHAEALDRQRRSFGDVLYATLEEAKAAREQHEQEEHAAGVIAPTIQASQRARTFNGVTFSTYEESWKARREFNAELLRSIFDPAKLYELVILYMKHWRTNLLG